MTSIGFGKISDLKTSFIEEKPKKSLGQNFLVDENIARKIVGSLKLTSEDVVVEIGPGQGALTKYIIDNVLKILAVEIDIRVAEKLKSEFLSKNIEIINQDFLEFGYREIFKKYKRKFRLVGNLPYHLTSPILFKAFENRRYISDFTFMIQKEVAHRIVGKKGTKSYGILAVLTQFYGKPEILFNVSSSCFYPKPKVTSTVVRLDFSQGIPYRVDEGLFKIVVKTTFGKRRKTIRNGLKYLPFDEQMNDRIIDSLNYPLQKRPEQLSIEDFVTLTNRISEILTL
jgi:16S rRNA (adenine1518-N6/adenine1519-N6)-dimethyltransferase